MLQIDHEAHGLFFRYLHGLNTAYDSSDRERPWEVTEHCPRKREHQAWGIL
jgi:hypothetical protein